MIPISLVTFSTTGGIFRNFFPTKPKAGEVAETGDPSKPGNVNVTTKKSSRHVIPLLEEEELDQLAEEFAAQIPEDELSVRVILPGLRLVDAGICRQSLCEVKFIDHLLTVFSFFFFLVLGMHLALS